VAQSCRVAGGPIHSVIGSAIHSVIGSAHNWVTLRIGAVCDGGLWGAAAALNLLGSYWAAGL
jgi:hypothetical protein